MSSYFILKNERPNRKFDAHIHGILLNEKREIIPNPFNKLELIRNNSKYFIKSIDKELLPGKFRDKLSVNVQNQESLFVVNNRITSLLKELCVNIQLYNLIILLNNEMNSDFKILNITESVNCINYDQSRVTYWDESHEIIYGVDRLILKEDVIPPNLTIFILGGIREVVIVVQKKIKEEIEEKKITGFNFCEVQDFVL